MDASIFNKEGVLMTDIRRHMAVGATVAAALILGANSLGRADAVSVANVRLERETPRCGAALQMPTPGCMAVTLHRGYAHAAGIAVELRNAALDVALDTAGNLIARFRQF